MRLSHAFLPVAALSPLALAQNQTAPISAQAAAANSTGIGNVSGFLPYRNTSTITAMPKPSSVAIPAGTATEFISIASSIAPSAPSAFVGVAAISVRDSLLGLGAALGAAAWLA